MSGANNSIPIDSYTHTPHTVTKTYEEFNLRRFNIARHCMSAWIFDSIHLSLCCAYKCTHTSTSSNEWFVKWDDWDGDSFWKTILPIGQFFSNFYQGKGIQSANRHTLKFDRWKFNSKFPTRIDIWNESISAISFNQKKWRCPSVYINV